MDSGTVSYQVPMHNFRLRAGCVCAAVAFHALGKLADVKNIASYVNMALAVICAFTNKLLTVALCYGDIPAVRDSEKFFIIAVDKTNIIAVGVMNIAAHLAILPSLCICRLIALSILASRDAILSRRNS